MSDQSDNMGEKLLLNQLNDITTTVRTLNDTVVRLDTSVQEAVQFRKDDKNDRKARQGEVDKTLKNLDTRMESIEGRFDEVDVIWRFMKWLIGVLAAGWAFAAAHLHNFFGGS